MNVASNELCQELFELSGWSDVIYWHQISEGNHSRRKWETHVSNGTPAYSLGFLLRKLPNVRVGQSTKNIWFARGNAFNEPSILALGDTPEDATCKLAIELFKQGVLK